MVRFQSKMKMNPITNHEPQRVVKDLFTREAIYTFRATVSLTRTDLS